MSTYVFRTWDSGKNFGGYLNRVCGLVPNPDDLIVITDGDVMFLTPDWGKQIEDITEANHDIDVFGCKMNRCNVLSQKEEWLFNSTDIQDHIENAKHRKSEYYTIVGTTNGPIAAACMWFRRSVWDQIKFKEDSIRFDIEFCFDAKNNGLKLGIASGLYVFHMYRYGSKDPANDYKHLLK